MAKNLYCWRCDMTLPMLEESEWALVEPLLKVNLLDIQRYRQEHGASLTEALAHVRGRAALDKYRELTGFEETNVNALWHHVVSLYGPPCASCGKPLRTPRASFCAACGATRRKRPPTLLVAIVVLFLALAVARLVAEPGAATAARLLLGASLGWLVLRGSSLAIFLWAALCVMGALYGFTAAFKLAASSPQAALLEVPFAALALAQALYLMFSRAVREHVRA